MTHSSDSQSFHCPQCNKRLKAPHSLTGKRVECPKCKARVLVPGPRDEVSDPDDWLELDAPVAKRPEAAPATDTPPTARRPSVFDDDLPDLAPMTESPTAKPPAIDSDLSKALEELSRDGAALQEYFQPADEEEFSFPCKVCGTLLYATVSRVGSLTRCPDCHSEFSIPSRAVKKKPPKIQLDDNVANVRLQPVETGTRARGEETVATKKILERAAVELERERREIDPVATAFDSKRWLSMIFGFLRDPGVVIVSILFGVLGAAALYGIHAMGSIEMAEVQLWILRVVFFAVLCVPLLLSVLMVGMAIVPLAANRQSRIEDWPFGRVGEAMGEATMALVAVGIAAFPGGVIATLLGTLGLPTILGEVMLVGCVWGLTPIVLLSMIDNNRITEPVSMSVLKSMGARPDAWGAMYMQTGMVMALLFILFQLAIVSGPANSALLGVSLPILVFFIANQYGILAGRISDITQLGYEGDFSEDQDDIDFDPTSTGARA